jgi:RNA polymerase sigma-70 factor, ECF subfamily
LATLEKVAGGCRDPEGQRVYIGVAEVVTEPETENGSGGADFSDFYRDNYGQLVGQAFVLVGNLGDAQELVQDALLKAWRRWDVPPPLEDPGKWVRVVMHRQAVASWRKREISRRWMFRLSQSDHAESIAGLPGEHLEVAVAARSLPANQRRALVLQAIVGLSIEEIAAEMEAPESTVRAWLSRARRRMAELLGVEDTFEGPLGKGPADTKEGKPNRDDSNE